ncbi:hypothetical protein NDU88_000469 [Pleurodeles waltl]|uniref:Uncharacterized protein n=1 Tax=Pleurodeles waltl TaxID=8319 RepID=A0AAV7MGY8_PLEWA|nr:hypothetical protein NDU88_000469 [Pleurodeles waltl]
MPTGHGAGRMSGDDTGVDGGGVGGLGLRCGTGRCFVYLTSGVHRPQRRQRRQCQQERCRRGCPGCGVSRRCRSAGPTGHGASSGLVKSSDDAVGETRVAVRSGAMRLRVASAGHGAGQRRRWRPSFF